MGRKWHSRPDLRGCSPQGDDAFMKAILLTPHRRSLGARLCRGADAAAGPGEVLVKADTIGVSRPELLVRRGVYAWMPPLPAIPGIEMAGTVAELGAGASRFDLGQKVYVTARELPVRAGCYAEYIAVPERALFALPPETDLEAAACLSNYQVAWHLLHTATRGAPGQVRADQFRLGRARKRRGSAREARRHDGDRAGRQRREGARAEGLRRRSRHRRKPRGCRGPRRRHHLRRRRRPHPRRDRRQAISRNSCRCSRRLALLVSYGKLIGQIDGNVIAALDNGPGLSQQRRGTDLHHAHARRQAGDPRRIDERPDRQARRGGSAR